MKENSEQEVIERLLKEVLSQTRYEESGIEKRNEMVLERWKQDKRREKGMICMKRKKAEENKQGNDTEEKTENNNRKIFPRSWGMGKIAAAVLVIFGISITAGAVGRFILGTEVAKMTDQKSAEEAFVESGEKIFETRNEGGYQFTLLEVADGDNKADRERFREFSKEHNLPYLGEEYDLEKEKTYLLIAVEKEDKTPMPSPQEEEFLNINFFVSPLIQGLLPFRYNIQTMNGDMVGKYVDGILYYLISCDTVGIFADRQLYLCIQDGWSYNTNAFIYHEEDGTITENEDYSGINILFDLSIDSSKANKEKAEAYIREMEYDSTEQDENMQKSENKDIIEGKGTDGKRENVKKKRKDDKLSLNELLHYPNSQLKIKDLKTIAKLNRDSVQKLEQKDGKYSYSMDFFDIDWDVVFDIEEVFGEKKKGKVLVDWFEEEEERIYIVVEKKKNGEIWGMGYEGSIPQKEY